MYMNRNKGFLMIEAVATIWIFTIFISLMCPIIKNSIKIKRSVIDEARYERNFLNVIEKMNEELNNAQEIRLRNANKISAIYYNYSDDGEISEKDIVYYFSEELKLKRYLAENSLGKEDILIEDVRGNFFQEDEFIKLKINYKNRDEEYVYKQK